MRLVLLALLAFLLGSCASVDRQPEGDAFADGRVRVAVHYQDLEALARAGGVVLRALPELGVAEVEVEREALPALERARGIVGVEPLGERVLYGDVAGEGADEAWHLLAMGLAEAWALSRGCGVVVAVLDEWPDAGHPDLRENVLPGYDAFTGREVEPGELEGGPHGTHVAGLVAAHGRAQGAAPCAQILPVRVFDEAGYVGDVGAAEALVWAVDHGAQVVNMSWGGAGYSTALALAVEYALREGAVLVAASGNEGAAVPAYPAAYPGVIAVGATTGSGELAWFSSRGYFSSLAAPGDRIFSTLPGGAYAYMSGTSMASPLVAGSAALLRALHPEADGWQVLDAFWRAGVPVAGLEEVRAVRPAGALAADLPDPGGCVKVAARSSDGDGVRLADVKLTATDGGRVYWTKTDGYGRVTLRNLEPGSYTVQVAGPEWPDLRAVERVVASAEVTADPRCPMVDLTLQSDLWFELAWEAGDVDLAVREGNWAWATPKEGARFGVFEGGDATDGGVERYRFTGGLSEAEVGFGAVNHTGAPVEVEARVHLNGAEWTLVTTLQAGEGVQELGQEAWVLSLP